jgi:hypothetical protein
MSGKESCMSVRWLALPVLLMGVAACGAEAPPAESGGAGAPAEAPAAIEPSGPRVFFVEPADGATVKSPVPLKFGHGDYTIAAVPQGTVETVRPDLGHHHVGVDTTCLPPGTVIPQAAPWVHFGGGQAEMEMQLPPGTHTLTLQIGDDKHTTIEGLCSTISITVVE